MRNFAFVLILVVAAGCASTDSVPSMRQHCEDRYEDVWIAAQTAVNRLGGRVIHASKGSGSILGRLNVDVLGAEIELHITLSRIPDHQPGTQEPVTVTVKAIEPGASEPSPSRIEELRSLEERYLRMVGERVICDGPT